MESRMLGTPPHSPDARRLGVRPSGQPRSASGHQGSRQLGPSCSTTDNYTDGSQFKKNLDLLLPILYTTAVNDGGFSTMTAGTGSDQVFGLAMCYIDHNETECLDCLENAAAGNRQLCPNSRTVSASYVACMFRYSDKGFFSVGELSTHRADLRIFTIESSSTYVKDMATTADARRRLMEELARRTGDMPQRFYNSSMPYRVPQRLGFPAAPLTETVYGLAQCTRDLAPSECNTCITRYSLLVPKYFPNNTEGAIRGHNCNLMYSLSPIKTAVLPDTAVPPSTSPPPRRKSIIYVDHSPIGAYDLWNTMTLPQAQPQRQLLGSTNQEGLSGDRRILLGLGLGIGISLLATLTFVAGRFGFCRPIRLPWAHNATVVWHDAPLQVRRKIKPLYGFRRGHEYELMDIPPISCYYHDEIMPIRCLWGNCYIPPRGHSTVLDERLLDERFSFKHESRQFQYNELANATANFSNLKMIGKGGFGPVYKGTLKLNGLDTEVAIKRMGEYSKQGIKEYVAEVNIIRHAKHQNLVKLIGWCHDREELLLVYELMANGSLDKHLHSEKDVFSWKKRYAVILGVGSALQYLHEGLHLPVLHRDIKPANVMLDDSFTAKLGDFGLARFVNHGDRLDNTIMAGTLGYMDPKCFQTQSVTAESDVYSFGVLLLEMACGKKPAVKTDQDEEAVVHISQWVLDMYSQGMDFNAVADPRLDGEFMDKQMEAVLDVGLWCVHGTPKRRPSARQAVNALRLDAELPRLREPADSDSMLRFEAQIWRASVKRKKVHDESDTKMGDVELDTITHGLRGPSEWKPAPIPKTENVYYGKENIGRKVQSETNEIETDTYGVYETAHSEMLEKDCITTSEWAELEEIIKCVNKTKETVNMVHIEDLIVKQKDLKCLTNPYLDNEKDKYLGDEVIDCFIEHHRRSTPSDIRKGGTVFVERVLNTYALQNDVRRNTGVQLAMGGSRKGIDYLRNNMIYLPIHDADHWYLVVVNTTIQHIQILNSLSHEGIQNEASCMYLHNTLMGMESDIRFALDQGGEEICTWSQRNFCVASWPRKVIRNVPLQRDGSSCGLYLIMNIINWTGRELAQQFDQATINKFRPELALILIKSPHNKLHKEPNKDKDDN